MDRLDKYNYYLDIAESVSKRGTCLRKRYGAVIVIISFTHCPTFSLIYLKPTYPGRYKHIFL